MIQSRYINGIIAGAAVLALIIALLIQSFAAQGHANSGITQQYESKLFGSGIISIEIEADPSEWEAMLENAMAEEYIMADVVVNGTRFQSVGIRPKGNSSLSQVAMSDTDRFSFRLKFDEYIDGQTCFGLNTFVLNNMLGDNSYLKEYLSYDIMHYIGVNTPLYEFADISVNGEKWGFYLAVEAYDDSYLSRVYGDTGGSLYNVKSMDMGERNGEGMPDGIKRPEMPGGERPAFPEGGPAMPGGERSAFPPGAPGMPGGERPAMPGDGPGMATQEGQMPMPGGGPGVANPEGQITDKPENMPLPEEWQMPPAMQKDGQIPDIPNERSWRQRPGGQFPGKMGGGRNSGGDLKYTDDDPDSYSAIFENAVGKTDEADHRQVITALKNLSTGTELEKYFDVDQILRYMAAHTVVVNLDSYSSNMAQNYYLYEKAGKISVLPWDYNYSFGGFQSGSAANVVNFPIDTPVSGVDLEDRPLFAKLLADEEYKTRYHQYLQEIVSGYFADGKWEAKVSQLNSLIAEYVKNDPSAFCTYAEYQKALPALITLGELRAESIAGQLLGTVPSTTAGQKDQPDALIVTDKLNLSDLGGGMKGGRRDTK